MTGYDFDFYEKKKEEEEENLENEEQVLNEQGFELKNLGTLTRSKPEIKPKKNCTHCKRAILEDKHLEHEVKCSKNPKNQEPKNTELEEKIKELTRQLSELTTEVKDLSSEPVKDSGKANRISEDLEIFKNKISRLRRDDVNLLKAHEEVCEDIPRSAKVFELDFTEIKHVLTHLPVKSSNPMYKTLIERLKTNRFKSFIFPFLTFINEEVLKRENLANYVKDEYKKGLKNPLDDHTIRAIKRYFLNPKIKGEENGEI